MKLLPQTKLNPKGFTLVELLVVIVILAILGVVGVTLFTGTQSQARDAKRKEDISAMANAMEAHYRPTIGYDSAMVGAWFADQRVPTNPAPGGATYGTGTPNLSSYTFCATLENSTGNATSITATGLGTTTSGGFFCKRNSQ